MYSRVGYFNPQMLHLWQIGEHSAQERVRGSKVNVVARNFWRNFRASQGARLFFFSALPLFSVFVEYNSYDIHCYFLYLSLYFRPNYKVFGAHCRRKMRLLSKP